MLKGSWGFSIEFSSAHPLICWGCCGTCVSIHLSLHPAGGVSGRLEGQGSAHKCCESRKWRVWHWGLTYGWGIKGQDCLTFVLFWNDPDPGLSVSGWITTIGSEGETEATGTTRTKTVRKIIISREATTACELIKASPANSVQTLLCLVKSGTANSTRKYDNS